MTQSPRDTEKAILRGNFVAFRSFLRKELKSHTNTLTLLPKSRKNQAQCERKEGNNKDQGRNKRNGTKK